MNPEPKQIDDSWNNNETKDSSSKVFEQVILEENESVPFD